MKPGHTGKGGKPSLAYKLRRSIPYVPTSLAKDNLLFLWSDAGIVTCAEAKTGKIHWQERVEGRFWFAGLGGGRLLHLDYGQGGGDCCIEGVQANRGQ